MGEATARGLLLSMGFQDIEFTGTTVWPDGRSRLLYRHGDGAPVMDAPVALVAADGSTELLPWAWILEEPVSEG